ncbi:histone-like nucleoid-structuring protein Lsr2 [Microbacterium sp. 22179]|uniref:histone-like nucleoid-structuring protein Lsr2 n=1 Tax=Microbacterium sp. 22179 TaxID=3453886 RepID=UPI003F850BFD
MATEQRDVLIDDLDGSEAHHTVAFAFRGRAYEIDLSTDHAAEFFEAIARYVEAARPVEYVNPREAPRPPTPAEVRAWAAQVGLKVSSGGRIAHSVQAAYAAAHP